MAHSENMNQKSDYQLNWIIANKPTYSESQVKAALEELKRRQKVNLKVEDINNIFTKFWDSILRYFKEAG